MSGGVLETLWTSGEDRFVEALGFLFEHSPWVAARAYAEGPFLDAAGLIAACDAVLKAAALEEKLDLIRAHPELAGRALIAGALTAASTQEQKTAGLDQLTAEEFDRFHALNRAYRSRFDFPFVICVRLSDKTAILDALDRRLANDREVEIYAALLEIARIARLRLDDWLASRDGP